MANMSYVRHENTYNDLTDVWERWYDYEEGSSEYEDRARKGIKELVREMYMAFAYDEDWEDYSE